MELTYPRKIVEPIILGLVDPLNQHLVKLVGFEFPAELRRYFRKEAQQLAQQDPTAAHEADQPDRLGQILFQSSCSIIRLAGTRPRPCETMMEFISNEYDDIEPAKSPEEMVTWLKDFHTRRCAEARHNGEAVLDMLPE